MAPARYSLSGKDIQVLRDIVQRETHRPRTQPNVPDEDDEVRKASDMYVGQVGAGGLTALQPNSPPVTPATPGVGLCDVYQVVDDGDALVPLYINETVYTVSLQAIPEDTWVLIHLDRGGAWWADSQANSTGNSVSYTSNVTSGGTTTLTSGSTLTQYFTGTSNETVQMPVVSTLTLGQVYTLINNSTGTLTVTSSGGNTIAVIPSGTSSDFLVTSTSGTGSGSWAYQSVGTLQIPGYATTATAAGTTTLTSLSPDTQYFTGTSTQTVQMPVTSTLQLGQSYTIVNQSTDTLTVNSSGGNTITTVPAGTTSTFTVTSITGTTAASWGFSFNGTDTVPGSTFIATAGTTTTLDVNSTQRQVFTGSSNQTVQMPVVSTLRLGREWDIVNDGTGTLTVTSSGGNTIATVAAGDILTVSVAAITGTTAASWDANYTGFTTVPGGTSWSTVAVTAAGSTLGTAAALTSGANNTVSGADGTKGVILDSGDAPTVVYNSNGLNTLKVYPPTAGDKITIFGSAGAAYVMNAATCQVFYKGASGQWFVGAQMT